MPAPRGKGLALGARLWSAGMGVAVTAMGALFVWYLWAAWDKARGMDDWVEVPCEVISASIDDTETDRHGNVKFTLVVQYRYRFEDRPFLGDRIKRLPISSSSPRKIDRQLERYPVGMETVCWVNPDQPEEAVLKRSTKAPLYTIWFPMIFVVGGLGMIAAAFRPRGKRG